MKPALRLGGDGMIVGFKDDLGRARLVVNKRQGGEVLYRII
jgi:hypothetical protein